MNSNLIHNIINVATLFIGLATAVLVATGCVESPDGSLSCEASFLTAEMTAWIITVLMAVKMLINIVRDGITGLVKKQPPVQ